MASQGDDDVKVEFSRIIFEVARVRVRLPATNSLSALHEIEESQKKQ